MAEVHAFVLWSSALGARERIRADLSVRFELLDAVEVAWSPASFPHNLRRLYGRDLPAGADKAAQIGRAPFLLFVVRDPAPVYGARHRSWGMGPVNVNAYDAKQRYREWAQGAFAVHASNDPTEASRDIFLLLGRRPSDYAGAPALAWTTEPRRITSDVVGAGGWRSLGELLTALELAGGYAALPRGGDIDPAAGELELLVGDGARVRALLGSVSPAGTTIQVAGRAWTVRVHALGDGDIDERWQQAILREAHPAPSGARVAGPAHRAYLALYRAVAHTRELRAPLAVRLDAEARRLLPPGDIGDPAFAVALVEAFLRANRWTFPVPADPATPRNPALLGPQVRLRRVIKARAPRLAKAGAAVERCLPSRAAGP
jgi:hypothetical protein